MEAPCYRNKFKYHVFTIYKDESVYGVYLLIYINQVYIHHLKTRNVENM